MLKISTSILAAQNRSDSIIKLNQTNTDYIHIDIMDGNFVPNEQFKKEEIQSLLPLSTKPVDIHLMVSNPLEYIDILNYPNIFNITIHLEITKDIKSILKTIKDKGYKCGIAIKPKTDIKKLIPYIKDIDLILIMSVEPGFGGQEFIPNTINRIKEIKELNSNLITEVDGGIKDTNINLLKDSIDIAVVGSYITNKSDYNEAINNLKN